MCSKNDSQGTYCSEVEELLKAKSVPLKNNCTNVPLRRSQRLYEKHKAKSMLSGNLSDSTKSRKMTYVEHKVCVEISNKFTQNIFSTQDIREVEETDQHYNISFNKIPSCVTQCSVPLDLSKKSKELREETLQTLLKAANAPIELESFRVAKNDNKERKKLSETPKQNILHFNKGRYPRRCSINKCSEAISNRNKLSVIKNVEKGSTKPIDSFCDKIYSLKRTYKKSLQSSKEKSPLTPYKIIKVSNDETINNLTENKNLEKISNNKLRSGKNPGRQRKSLIKDCTHINLNTCTKSSAKKNPEKATNKTSGSVENTNHLWNNSSESNKLKNDVKLTDRNINNINILNKPNRSCIFNVNNAKTHILTDNFNNPETKLNLKIEDITKIQPIKRSQKRKYAKMQSHEFHNIHKNIISKPFSSINMYSQANEETNLNKMSTAETVSNRSQNNTTQYKNQMIKCELPISPKFSGSATTANESQKLPDVKKTSSENKSKKLKYSCKNAKTKTFSSKINKLSDQHIDEDVLNQNELKNLKLITTESQENYSLKNINYSDKSIQEKTEVKSENSLLNKNYLKSFDRTKFLDKIQNSRNDLENLSSQNNNSKPKIYESLLTPTELSNDLLKRSILPDIYPPHFKDQLPPEVLLTQTLERQPYPANVITPDDTVSTELLESSSSSPSLPESLCEFFQDKDIKKILNVERKSYRLYNYHIQTLALFLNLRFEYLSKIMDKLINMSPHVLKNIHKTLKTPFVPDSDIFATSPDNHT